MRLTGVMAWRRRPGNAGGYEETGVFVIYRDATHDTYDVPLIFQPGDLLCIPSSSYYNNTVNIIDTDLSVFVICSNAFVLLS